MGFPDGLIVTGGASHGAASAALLESAGARVVIADLQPAKDTNGRFVRHDVAAEDSWKSLLADVLANEGRLDIMVNNAGITGGMGSPETTTVENWQRVQAINSEGVFLGCKYALQGMKKTGPDKPAAKGSIVNISSIAGLVGAAGPTAYSASKGAVRLLSKSVALYCAEQKYRHPLQLGASGRRHADLQPAVAGGRARARQDVLIGAIPSAAWRGRGARSSCCGWPRIRSSFVTGAEIVADGGITSGLQGD
jgi:3(or 17)beta-hydroxysteroid dehydrogenase